MATVHVYPVPDLIEHDTEADDCVCGPSIEFVQGDEGSGWVVSHHSLDGRELKEVG